MENNYVLEEITYTKKKKFLFELKDILAGTAFPFIISVLFSATIIAITPTGRLWALVGSLTMAARHVS